MEHKLSFGICCFHFGIKKHPPFKFSSGEYLSELRKVLELIPNINNVKIDCDDEFKNYSIKITDEIPEINENVGYFPNPILMEIEFEVYIPSRIQHRLYQHARSSAEKFRIFTRFGYFLPVTFIEPIDSSEEFSPSEAVIIVREFLEQEFKKVKSSYIRFEHIGPSPFHADCYIERGEKDIVSKKNWKIESKCFPQLGYDNISFYFNSEQYINIEEGKDGVFSEILSDLSFFYYIVQIDNEKMHKWQEIQGMIDQLILSYRDSFFKKVVNFFVCAKKNK